MKTVQDIEAKYPNNVLQRQYFRKVLAYRIPISELETVQKIYRAEGKKVSFRFRGPRKGLDNRSAASQRQDCLKHSATSFTVYERRNYN